MSAVPQMFEGMRKERDAAVRLAALVMLVTRAGGTIRIPYQHICDCDGLELTTSQEPETGDVILRLRRKPEVVE